jgi:hypothetical protein
LSRLLSLTPLTEPLLGAIEPLLRVFVDMGYTDRLNLDPATPTPFSLFTPADKFVEALHAIPGALAEGAANLFNGGHAAISPQQQNVNAFSIASTSAPEDGDHDALRAGITSTPDPVVPQTNTEPTPPATDPAPLTKSTTLQPKSRLKLPGDGLHPTLISHGSKFVPGGGINASTTDGGVGTTTTASTSTTTTPTPITGTTPTGSSTSPPTTGTTTGATKGDPPAGDESPGGKTISNAA